MSDPIAPPNAKSPEEALDLLCQAFSDGDVEAALAQYEDSAQLMTWAGRADDGGLRGALEKLMALRLPLSIRIREVLHICDLSVVLCERRIVGIGPDCEHLYLRGYGFAAIRPQPDDTWRIAIDAWCLEAADPPDPPGIPLDTPGDAGRDEERGRATSDTDRHMPAGSEAAPCAGLRATRPGDKADRT